MQLSLQLYTVRDALGADLEGTLAAVREMGLDYVELAGFYGKTAAEFGAILAKHDLKISGSHVGIDGLEQRFDEVVEENRTLGNQWVIVPYISDDQRKWGELARRLNVIGAKLFAEGMKLVYHNHDFELGPDDGLRKMFAETDPKHVWFQIDLGWVQYAGQDPAALVRDFGARAPLVHFKDMITGAENPHVVAGDGNVDWTAVISACKETGVEFAAIEMDRPPNDPVEDVRTCVKFFRARL